MRLPFRFITFAILAFTSSEVCGEQDPVSVENITREEIEPKIVGGFQAIPHEFPWLVRIQPKFLSPDMRICGGTIIKADLILTSAFECGDLLLSNNNQTYEVMAGCHDTSKSENSVQVKNIKSVMCHPQSLDGDKDTLENDICLVKLDSKFKWSREVAAAELASVNTPIQDSAVVAGWGITNTTGSNSALSPVLRKVKVPIVDNPTCAKTYGFYPQLANIPPTMMCAGETGKAWCTGDEGSPLMCVDNSTGRYVVCGIASSEYECGLPGIPGIYTRVSSYRKWISKHSSAQRLSYYKSLTALVTLIVWLIKT